MISQWMAGGGVSTPASMSLDTMQDYGCACKVLPSAPTDTARAKCIS
jgi:hypothetical protein